MVSLEISMDTEVTAVEAHCLVIVSVNYHEIAGQIKSAATKGKNGVAVSIIKSKRIIAKLITDGFQLTDYHSCGNVNNRTWINWGMQPDIKN